MKHINKIIKEICKEEEIKLDSYCDEFGFKLSKNNKSTFIYDSVFENNSSAVYKILRDKSAVFELLHNHNIPCVEHFYFYSSSPADINLTNKLKSMLQKHKKI